MATARTLFSRVAVGGLVVALPIAVMSTVLLTDEPSAVRFRASEPEASLFDEASARVVANDPYGTTWQDANGVFKQTVSLVPTQVERDGVWIPASNAITEVDDALVATDHPLVPSFGQSFEQAAAYAIEADGHLITFRLQGEFESSHAMVEQGDAPSDPSTITYPDVAEGTDLEYTVSQGTVKESFVLDGPPSEAPQYSWIIDAPGLDAVRNTTGGVDFVSPDGTVVVNIPIPGMWDSSGEFGDADGRAINIDFDLTALPDGTFEFTLKPDFDWLRDPATVYPVYVDPSSTYGADGWESFKKTGTSTSYASSTSKMYIGNPKQGTWAAWRTLIHFPFVNLASYRLTGATLNSNVLNSNVNCYGGYVSVGTAWTWTGRDRDVAYFPNCSYGEASDDNMTAQYAYDMVNANWARGYVLSGDEGNVYSLKQLTVTMTFYYVANPSVTGVTGLSPLAAGSAAEQTPEVTADNVVLQAVGTDNGYGKTFVYTIKKAADGTIVWTSPTTAEGPYRVPDTVLTPGQLYTYEVKICDTLTKFSQKCPVFTNANWRFHVQDRPSVVADSVTVDGQSITSATVTAGSGKPTLAATVSDPDGGSVWAMFTVKRDGVVVMDSVPGSKGTVTAGGTFVSSVVLPYAISAGSTYTVEVQAFDGSLASVSQTPGGGFLAPPRSVREIPGTDDSDTEATS